VLKVPQPSALITPAQEQIKEESSEQYSPSPDMQNFLNKRVDFTQVGIKEFERSNKDSENEDLRLSSLQVSLVEEYPIIDSPLKNDKVMA